VDEAVGTDMVGGMGVSKIEANVLVDAGVVPAAGFADSGVDADSVANRFEVGVGADVHRLQARSRRRSPLNGYIRLFIDNIPTAIIRPLNGKSLITRNSLYADRSEGLGLLSA